MNDLFDSLGPSADEQRLLDAGWHQTEYFGAPAWKCPTNNAIYTNIADALREQDCREGKIS